MRNKCRSSVVSRRTWRKKLTRYADLRYSLNRLAWAPAAVSVLLTSFQHAKGISDIAIRVAPSFSAQSLRSSIENKQQKKSAVANGCFVCCCDLINCRLRRKERLCKTKWTQSTSTACTSWTSSGRPRLVLWTRCAWSAARRFDNTPKSFRR